MRPWLALITLSVCLDASAQLYSLTSGTGFPLVTIDPTTGLTTPVLTTGVPSAYGGISTYDFVSRRLFFLTGGVGSQEMVTVDLTTNSVTRKAIPSADPYIFFEYDQVTHRVLSALSAPGTPVVSIDPVSGTVTPFATTGVAGAWPGLAAIDPAARRLYFLTGTVGWQRLAVLDLHDGSTLTYDIASPYAYSFFRFDPVTNRILTATSAPGVPLLSITPTGNVSTMVVTGASTSYAGLAAIDVVTRRLFFLSGYVGSQQLVTVRLASLEVSSVSIAQPVAYIFFEYQSDISEIPALSLSMMAALAAALLLVGTIAARAR